MSEPTHISEIMADMAREPGQLGEIIAQSFRRWGIRCRRCNGPCYPDFGPQPLTSMTKRFEMRLCYECFDKTIAEYNRAFNHTHP